MDLAVMLLLAQNSREVILLETTDGTIELRITRIEGDEARIGIEVPQSVRIIRQELEQPPTEPPPPDASNTFESVSVSQAAAGTEEALVDFQTESAIQESAEDPWWLHPSEQYPEPDPDNDITPVTTITPALAAAADDDPPY